MSNGTSMLAAWCETNQTCNPCATGTPPEIGPGGAIPPFTVGEVSIQQLQTIYGTHGDPGTSTPGGITITTAGVNTGAFGDFLVYPAPYTVVNSYVSTLQILVPWMQNSQYSLPTITVGGSSNPSDVDTAQQAAINQAYDVLGISPS